MASEVYSASKSLVKARVTGFKSETRAGLIYSMSVMWILFLIGIESVALASERWDKGHENLVSSLVANIGVIVFQTVDWEFFHFTNWFINSLNWVCQLSAIGFAAALLSVAVLETGGNRDNMISVAIVHLIFQCLLTASQLGVTLEYMERSFLSLQAATAPLPQSFQRQRTMRI
jgi:hypothetical protein